MPAINELPAVTGDVSDDMIFPAFCPSLVAPQTRRMTRGYILGGVARTGAGTTVEFGTVTADNLIANDGITCTDTIERIISVTDTVTLPSIASLAEATVNFTATGAVVGDMVLLTLPSALSGGIICRGYVASADTVTIKAFNATGSSFGGGAQSIRAMVIGHSVAP